MSNREEIALDELDNVNGGQITYTWNGEYGSIGINGNNVYKLLDKAAFLSYYNSVKDEMSESQILKNLKAKGIVVKP